MSRKERRNLDTINALSMSNDSSLSTVGHKRGRSSSPFIHEVKLIHSNFDNRPQEVKGDNQVATLKENFKACEEVLTFFEKRNDAEMVNEFNVQMKELAKVILKRTKEATVSSSSSAVGTPSTPQQPINLFDDDMY